MTALQDIIKNEIENDGPITISRYMELALAHPEFGYYMKQDPFGEDGDFITAPEITQMFGEIIGIWAAVVWQGMGGPENINLVELGPGRGTLMADCTRAASALEAFEDALRITFVETSPVLREMQKKNLLSPEIRMPAWRDSFDEVNDGPLIVIANEFFDALPIDQYEKSTIGWHVRVIDWDDEAGALIYAPAEKGKKLDDESIIPPDLRNAPVGAIFEHSPMGEKIISSIAQRISKFGGAALIIDYGHIERGIGDTLQAIKNHSYFDALADPGNVDITAHVDFATLGDVAQKLGVNVMGPVPQGAFLARLGLRQRADRLMLNASAQQVEEIEEAYARLVEAEQMGTLFKVMCLASPGLGVPPWSA
ncbi:MAG: SAM-dependent methyltransferase [Rhodospirillaceae bacterium]|nr:SAM-dependent methyltransferase [Rhodospirillaceae bacterium]